MTSRIRTYRELVRLHTFKERFEYLSLRGSVGYATFGYERWVNQAFYRSAQWRHIRQQVIARDLACDLAFPDHEIHDRLIVHHMNPMSADEIVDAEDVILDPEFLITTQHATHNAIHYGDASLLPAPLVERRPGDTKLW